jgi:hypothetical protein
MTVRDSLAHLLFSKGAAFLLGDCSSLPQITPDEPNLRANNHITLVNSPVVLPYPLLLRSRLGAWRPPVNHLCKERTAMMLWFRMLQKLFTRFLSSKVSPSTSLRITAPTIEGSPSPPYGEAEGGRPWRCVWCRPPRI